MLGSVTAASPSCNPVRREVFSTSGTDANDMFHVCDDAIGFLQRAPRRHDVIENEAAFVHVRKQVGAELAVAQVGDRDQNHAEASEPDRMLQRAAQPALIEHDDSLEEAAPSEASSAAIMRFIAARIPRFQTILVPLHAPQLRSPVLPHVAPADQVVRQDSSSR